MEESDTIEHSGTIWQKKEGGFFLSFVSSIFLILFKPGDFFKDWNKANFNFIDPIIFCVFVYALSHVSSVILGKDSIPAFVLKSLAAPFALFIVAGLVHIVVILLKGNGGFGGTYSVIAYGVVKNFFLLIPQVGFVFWAVWLYFISFYGYKNVHKLSNMKTIILLAAASMIGVLGRFLIGMMKG